VSADIKDGEVKVADLESADFGDWTCDGSTCVLDNPGVTQATGDDRYVNTSGDTMTGALTINNEGAEPSLNVAGTMSGEHLYISGTGSTPELYTYSGKVGIGTASLGERLQVGDLTDGVNADNFIRLATEGADIGYLKTGVKFRSHSDLYGFTIQHETSATNDGFNILRHEGSVIGVSAFWIHRPTGNVGIGTTTPSTLLDVTGAMSGHSVHARDLVTASGGIIIEEGNTLRINGVTYTFPPSDGVSSGWVLKTNAAGTLSWAAETSSVSQTEADDRYVNTSGDTMTGNLVLQGKSLTATGVYVTGTLASSGTLTVEGIAQFDTTVTITEGALTDSTIVSADIKDGEVGAGDIGANAVQLSELDVSDVSDDIAGDIAEGELADSIIVSADIKDGEVKVADLESADFGDWTCDGSTCVLDNPGVTETTGDARYVEVAGDTMTGDLVIQSANLTATGVIVTGNATVSGSLSVDGASSIQNNLDVVGTMSGTSLQVTGTGATPIIYTDQTTGRVGIGTATPSQLLDVSTTNTAIKFGNVGFLTSSANTVSDISTNAYYNGSDWIATGNNKGWRMQINSDSNDPYIAWLYSSQTGGARTWSEKMRVNNSGNVGIGDTGPDATLEISEEGTTPFMISNGDSGDGNFMIVTTTGDIGIGDKTPQTKLDVAGGITGATLEVTGAATFGSTVSLGGVTYTFPPSDGVSSGWVLKTDSAGTLSWAASSGGVSQSEADARYVNVSGDTMTGNLVLQGKDLTASGVIVTENATVSGALSVDGNVSAQGSLSGASLHVSRATTTSGTVKVQNSTDSTTSFQVKDADGGTPVFNVDTTNERVGIGVNTGLDPRIGLSVAGDLDVIHTATEMNDHALELDVDAAGFGDVKAIDIDYITGAISAGEDEGIILINVDETLSTGGDIFAVEVLATEGSAGIYGLKTGAGIGPIHQDSGTFANPTTGTDNTASTDVAAMIDGSVGTTTAIFEADNEYIIIGAAAAFEEIEFILTTQASVNIKPTFWYSTTGAGQFTQFTPVDGTNGFRNTGVVAWDASDLTGHTTNDDTGTFDIKVIRTKNNLSTSPILGYAKTAATTEYLWDKSGNVNVNNLAGSGTISIEGASSLQGTVTLGSTLTINSVTYTFPPSDGVSSGWVLKTDSAGTLSWAADNDTGASGLTQAAADDRYVNTSGDTMTGSLDVSATISGTTLHISSGSTFSSSNITFSETGSVVFNELGNDVDFRIEGDTDTDLFYVDASTEKVGISVDFSLWPAFATLQIEGTDAAESGTSSPNGILALSAYGVNPIITMGSAVADDHTWIQSRHKFDTATYPLVLNPRAGNVGIGETDPSASLTVSGSAIFNEAGYNYNDVRIEGDTDANLFFSDASADMIGIGTSSPSTKLEVLGTMSGRRLSVTPTVASETGALFVDVDQTTSTGVLIDSEAQTGAALAIDVNSNISNNEFAPHILFGYNGSFDARMYLTDTGALRIKSTSGATLTLDTESSTATDNIFRMYSDVTSNENIVFRVQADGKTYADGAYSSAGADYAEWFKTVEADLEPGEVVCLDPDNDNMVRRCRGKLDDLVVGAVSTNPAFIGGYLDDDTSLKVLVGLIGQVTVQVIRESGPIRRGDELVPASIAGTARKATPWDRRRNRIGIALESFSGERGGVKVLLK